MSLKRQTLNDYYTLTRRVREILPLGKDYSSELSRSYYTCLGAEGVAKRYALDLLRKRMSLVRNYLTELKELKEEAEKYWYYQRSSALVQDINNVLYIYLREEKLEQYERFLSSQEGHPTELYKESSEEEYSEESSEEEAYSSEEDCSEEESADEDNVLSEEESDHSYCPEEDCSEEDCPEEDCSEEEEERPRKRMRIEERRRLIAELLAGD